MRSIPTRLPYWHDETCACTTRLVGGVCAEVMLHDSDGAVFLCKVWCGSTADIVPAAERMAEERDLDLGVSDWAAAS